MADTAHHQLALLDAVAGLGDDVVVEFLEEPTLKALSRRLRDRSADTDEFGYDGATVYFSGFIMISASACFNCIYTRSASTYAISL